MLLKDPERQAWANRHIELCGLHLQIGSLGSGSIIEGKSSSAGYLVYVPLSNFQKHVANGTVLKDNSILILDPCSDFCLSVRGPHKGCLIYVPKQKLRRFSNHRPPSTNGGQTGCQIIPVTRKLAGEVRSFIHETESAASASSRFEFSQEAKNSAAVAVRLVSAVILKGQCIDFKNDGRPRISRQEIIHRCKELIEERGVGQIKVREMASRAEVSERTLQTAFNEYFGVAPTRYLQLRQLRQINIALQAAQPDGSSVAEILSRHGEWEYGRFAKRYRNLFGELPSQTLQRQRQSSLFADGIHHHGHGGAFSVGAAVANAAADCDDEVETVVVKEPTYAYEVAPPRAAPAPVSAESRLAEAKSLFDKNLISEDEYQQKREQILASM